MLILDHEKIVHELSCLYMMLEIKEGKLESSGDDVDAFIERFKHLYDLFHGEIYGK